MTVELPRWPLADRLSLVLVVAVAVVIEAVAARHPGVPAGLGVAAATLLALGLWSQRRRRPQPLEFAPGAGRVRFPDGRRQPFQPGAGSRQLGTSVVLHWHFLLALSAVVASPIAQTTLPVLAVAGERFKLVLKGDGTVVGWGNFSYGQLGTLGGVEKGSEWISRQVKIALPRKSVGIAAGETTSYAVLDDGTVMAWGRGESGQLGNGPAGTTGKLPNGMTGSLAPVRVTGLGDIIQIVAARDSALALRKDGTVWAWGGRGAGVIGDGLNPKRYGESGPSALVPVRVPGVSGITQISTSGMHAMAVTSDGRVLTWATNTHGALGREPRRELPIDEAGEVPGLTGVAVALAGQGAPPSSRRTGGVGVGRQLARPVRQRRANGSTWHEPRLGALPAAGPGHRERRGHRRGAVRASHAWC